MSLPSLLKTQSALKYLKLQSKQICFKELCEKLEQKFPNVRWNLVPNNWTTDRDCTLSELSPFLVIAASLVVEEKILPIVIPQIYGKISDILRSQRINGNMHTEPVLCKQAATQ